MNQTEMLNRINAIMNDASLDDDNANFSLAIRDLLMNDELLAIDSSALDRSQRRALLELRDLFSSLATDHLSQLRLDASLCPYHLCDYAICFDDDDAECAAIRSCFPSHDT